MRDVWEVVTHFDLLHAILPIYALHHFARGSFIQWKVCVCALHFISLTIFSTRARGILYLVLEVSISNNNKQGSLRQLQEHSV